MQGKVRKSGPSAAGAAKTCKPTTNVQIARKDHRRESKITTHHNPLHDQAPW